jgi:hypothetical protein
MNDELAITARLCSGLGDGVAKEGNFVALLNYDVCLSNQPKVKYEKEEERQRVFDHHYVLDRLLLKPIQEPKTSKEIGYERTTFECQSPDQCPIGLEEAQFVFGWEISGEELRDGSFLIDF